MDPKSLFKHEHSMAIYEELVKRTPNAACFWKWFVALAEVPRPSFHIEGVAAWLLEKGKALGAEVKEDKLHNVWMRVPASKGKEGIPAVVLQGHMDMVGTKLPTSSHNFEKDPIKIVIDGDLITADATTLGADDGTGVASALTILEERDTFEHGPIEVLITVDEEVGLLGANGLVDGELLSKEAGYLINIDSEEFGLITVSSAGCGARRMHLPVKRVEVPAGYTLIEYSLKDFEGGHTGVQIHEDHANAGRWAVDLVLHNAVTAKPTKVAYGLENDLRLVSFEFGHAHNATPIDATVSVAVKNELADALVAAIKSSHEHHKALYAGIENKGTTLTLNSKPCPAGTMGLTHADSHNVLNVVDKIPYGVYKWSNDIHNLVESSQAACIGRLKDDVFEVGAFVRSATTENCQRAMRMFELHAEMMGATVDNTGMEDVGGWPADLESKLLKTSQAVFKSMFGMEPSLFAIHAGLENSVIMNKYPSLNLQSISIGPSIRNPHTADETCEIKSADDNHQFVKGIVEALCK